MLVQRYCLSKNKMCFYATEFGYCSTTVCTQSISSSTSDAAVSSGIEQSLPDELVINGVKYVKVADSK